MVQCPYCFEWVELWLEPDLEGSLVMDCEVCCNPWQVEVRHDDDGSPSVEVSRAQ
jgi:hypothetical protein